MSFNYRVVKNKNGYAIHEVFYKDDGALEGCTEKPLSVVVDSVEGLRHELELYLKALNQPAIEIVEK